MMRVLLIHMKVRDGFGRTGDQPFIQPKTKGAGIMVSDLITHQDGYLMLSSDMNIMCIFWRMGVTRNVIEQEKSLLPMCGMRWQLSTSNSPANTIAYCGYLIRPAAIVPKEKML